MKLFCVEIGCRQAKNLCRMLATIAVPARTPAEAAHYVERHCPELLRRGAVQRVFEAKHIVIDWPSGSVVIAERDQPTTSYLEL